MNPVISKSDFKFAAFVVAVTVILTLTGCKKEPITPPSKQVEVKGWYVGGWNTQRQIFVNGDQRSSTQPFTAQTGDVINVRNRVNDDGDVEAGILIDGTLVATQVCGCDINYFYTIE